MEENNTPLTEEQNSLVVYQNKLNKFITLLSEYSGSSSQIKRAWISSAISPMNIEEFNFSYPEEKELFDLFTELNSAKFVLMVYGMIREGKLSLLSPLMEEKEKTPSEQQLDELKESLVKEQAKEEKGETNGR